MAVFIVAAYSCAHNANVAAADVDLSIRIVGLPVVVVDRQYEYQLRVENHGPDSSPSVDVTEVLPANVSLVSAVPKQGVCTGILTVTCNLGGIAPFGFSYIDMIVTAPSVPSSFINTASVADNVVDPDLTNNTASNTVDVLPVSASADRSVTMQDSPDPVPVSGEVIYTINATNNGPVSIPSGGISFSAPSLTMLDFNFTSGLVCEPANCGVFPLCVNVSVRVTCFTGPMAPGATVQAQISVDAQGPTPITATADFSNANYTATSVPDPDNNNDVATESTEIVSKVIASSGGGGGCTLSTKVNHDPTLLAVLMMLVLVKCERQRRN
jgi:uncharacterized repeat protein (TIGR01451 family)